MVVELYADFDVASIEDSRSLSNFDGAFAARQEVTWWGKQLRSFAAPHSALSLSIKGLCKHLKVE